MADQSPAPLFFYQRDIIGNHETWRRLGMSASTEIGFQWWKLALNWQYILLVGGFKPFLFSISYMGCHPSHWLSYFSRWFKPPTRLVISPAKYGDFIGTWRYFINDAWVKGLTPSSNWASLVGDSHHLPTRCPIAKLVYTLSFPQWYPLVMSK